MSTRLNYCLFCETGREAPVAAFLGNLGFEVIPAVTERLIFKRKKETRVLRPILPGYVFFTSAREPDWKAVYPLNFVYRPLEYGDHSKALRGKDLDFVQWLLRRKGVIELSQAIQAGTRIKIVSGPLKEYEGSVVKINSRSQCAEVKIDAEGIVHTIWLSYEVIGIVKDMPPATDPAAGNTAL